MEALLVIKEELFGVFCVLFDFAPLGAPGAPEDATRPAQGTPMAPQQTQFWTTGLPKWWPTRLRGRPMLTLEGHPWAGWLKCGPRMTF